MKTESFKLKNWTGERLETFVDSESTLEHLHRYAIVLELTKDKIVLDIASGEGYGSHLIAGKAREVTGVDISAEVVNQAKAKYKKDNLRFVAGSAFDIPLPDGYFDVVVSFETIEHHDQHERMLSQIKRVLKPGGLMIISSPDKLYYSDLRRYHNEFHVKELYENEFKDLVRRHFAHADFYYQQPTFASLLLPEKEGNSLVQYTGSYNEINKITTRRGMFIVSIASDKELPLVKPSVFTDDEMIFKLNKIQIENIKSSLSYKIGHTLLWPFKSIRNLLIKRDK